MSEIDIFITFKKINDKTKVILIRRFIKYVSHTFSIDGKIYILYTYTLKLPKNKFEDDIYEENPELLSILPRACSILTCNNNIISSLEGPTKFSGRTCMDEDPEEGMNDASSNTIYNHGEIVKWAKEGILEIIKTEKANGKFAIVKIINHNDKIILMCGSKNSHVVMAANMIDDFIQNNKCNEIITCILTDIKKYINILTCCSLMKMFNMGYSLAGELCDGQHFTDGDNTISWFGFFKNGMSMNTMEALNLLKMENLKTVPFSKIFDNNSSAELLDNVFITARCNQNEGEVLYCRNTETNKIVLVKTKSVIYIVKRFMRQIILKGYKEIESIVKRFIQAQSYHGLGTMASIRVTKQLIDFAMWMISKSYPCSILGIQPVSSVRGNLVNGFNNYWKQFLQETNTSEIDICYDDFGIFNEKEYIMNSTLYIKRSFADPAIVVFIQGIQGSGKSTVAHKVCEKLTSSGINCSYLEQDMFWGDTLACQGALYHMVSNKMGPKVIIVSRCNVNEKQYKRYLDIIAKLPCIVTFVTPQNIDPLYLMISLTGILNRSNKGDNLMVGRFEYGIEEVVRFTLANYKEFEPMDNNLFQTHTNNIDMLTLATEAMDTNIIQFIQTNMDILHSLRLPINTIATQIIDIIQNTINGSNSYIITQHLPSYIGLAVYEFDRFNLTTMVNKYIPDANNKLYIHHCTLVFLGGKKQVPVDLSMVKPGQKVTAMIDAIVVRKIDNAGAFRIKNLRFGDIIFNLPNTPHITAKIPLDENPMCSNSFVGLNDDTVNIIEMTYELELVAFRA